MTLFRAPIAATICVAAIVGATAAPVSAQAQVTPPVAPHLCRVVQSGLAFPDEARETSGLARSALHSDHLWTHNDAGGQPELFAVDAAGQLIRRVRVNGASLVDWEDIEAAPCSGGHCLYIGDIGDNDGDRDHIVIYRIPEPADRAVATAAAVALRARFPDGARDTEALFADPAGNLYLVNKGRREPISLYRYPAASQSGGIRTLERVRGLFPQPADDLDRVTGASASPDGRWVAVRTYRSLYIYAAAELFAGDGAVQPLVVDLSAVGESQGEGVILTDDGTVWLSSEAESSDAMPSFSRLRCTLPR